MKCLWEKLKIAGSSLYCNTFDDFEDKTKHTLKLWVQDVVDGRSETVPVGNDIHYY
ncbi:MAG: hypothetical protein IPN15_14570 [Saprospiraceae bacterium]|nr:hypothetical protein [Candidatus Vicinibacter affinis]